MHFLRNGLFIFVSVLGLNSLTDDFVEFVNFVGVINEVYREFRDFVFSWLPIDLPSGVKDYLIIGTAVAGSYVWADEEHPSPIASRGGGFVSNLLTRVVMVSFMSAIWPLIILASLPAFVATLLGYEADGGGLINSDQPVYFFRNIAIAIFVYVVVLFVFSDARELLST